VSKSHILIAGAGIGGIGAALALRQHGFEISLYEQAAELHELGAGVQISPNGSCVLREIGLQPVMEAIASMPTSSEVRLFNTGQSWSLRNSANAVARYGAPFWLVHRGDFHQALVAALERQAPGAVHVGARCMGFEQDAAGVTLLLEDGERVHGDALIGEALFAACATFTGFMAWRGVVPMDRLPARLRQQTFTGWMGPTGLVVTYPMRGGELLNFVADVERSDWVNESWSEAGTIEECRRDFPSWHEDVQEIIGAISIPYKWALLARDPLQHWSVGRVSLLGDACHPLLPFLGQGANMAIEDGMVLARCLSEYADVPEALRHYENARLERTSRMAQASLENVSHMHNPQLADPAQAQAFMDRAFSAGALRARYDWLYEYNAMTVPV
jgi:2-polyprenyl-6-methoxyphenol hydroxylase-like FAD-dependent oxidoreductase